MKTKIYLFLIFGFLICSCCRKKHVHKDNLYNVKAFGAKGNGDDNDYQAVKKAVRAIHKSGGGTLFFPKGEYVVKSTEKEEDYLFLFRDINNVSIQGESQAESIIIPKLTKYKKAYFAFRFYNASNIEVSEISFHGEHELTTSNGSDQINNFYGAMRFLDNCNNILIENTSLKYFIGPSIQMSNSGRRAIVKNTSFSQMIRKVTGDGRRQPQPTGILINKGLSDIKIDSCVFENIIDLNGKKSHAIYLANVSNAIIRNNTFKKDKSFSFHENQSGGVQIYSGSSDKIELKNNVFSNVLSHLANGTNISFHDNTLKNSRLVVGASNTLVFNNSFDLDVYAPSLGLLRTAGRVKRLRVLNNTFNHKPTSGNYSYAIQFYDSCVECIVENNSISNFHTAIYLGQRSKKINIQRCSLIKNKIQFGSDSQYGINFSSGKNNIVSDNTFSSSSDKRYQAIRTTDSYDRNENNNISKNEILDPNIKNAIDK